MKHRTATNSQAWTQQKLYIGPGKYVYLWLTNKDKTTSETDGLTACFFFYLKVNFTEEFYFVEKKIGT